MQSFDVCDGKADRVIVLGPEGTKEIPYSWGLAGPGGAWFILRPERSVSTAYIEEAKSCLRRNRDVVSLSVCTEGVE
jgi:hypothetical protein